MRNCDVHGIVVVVVAAAVTIIVIVCFVYSYSLKFGMFVMSQSFSWCILENQCMSRFSLDVEKIY